MFRGKQFEFLIVVFLGLAATAEAQSRLNFPRQLSAVDLSTTGIALVNTSPALVTATFNFYGTDGLLVTQSMQNVPSKGQLARLASEIFPTVKTAGWVQVVSSSPELQGFELVGDFVNVEDGAGPAPEGKQLALIDFSREDVVHIVNTGSQAGTVQVTLNNAAGGILGTRSIPLAPFQPASLRLGDVNDDNNIDLVALSADITISAALTTKLPGGLDIGVTNATLIPGAASTLFFPFAPNGPQGASNWTTYLGIANLASTAQTVSLTFTPDTGAPVTIQRSLAPSAAVGDTVANLFSAPSNTFTAGWIRVNGSGALAGVAAYRDSTNGSLAIVPSQSSGATAFFFGHIASLAPWYTGIALLNTTNTIANAEIYAIDSSGQLVGSVASFTLNGGTRDTKLLSQRVPEVLQRATDGGWVFVRTTNNVPLLGFELFGRPPFPILANVQGFALPSTSTFTPPGSAGSSADVDHVTITDNNSVPKTLFEPRDTITLYATVTSTGASGPAQLTFSVKDPRGQTMFTNSVPITLQTNPTDFGFTGFIPSNALNGQYAFTASVLYQGTTASKSAPFSVTGGTNTPTVGQEPAIPSSNLNTSQVSFRPGDAVRFTVPTANFTSDAVTATLNYQLTGPGMFNAGSGSLTYTVPTGISFRTIDMVIPQAAQLGLLAFTTTFTASGSTSTKGTAVTVVPKSSSEAILVDHVFVSDSSGIPRAGFTPGSSIILNVGRVSTFGVTTPATVRYTVTGPNSSVIFDQPATTTLSNGGSVSLIPLTLSANATPGTYTFQSSVSYQDNNNSPKTSNLSTTFVVGSSPPTIALTVTTQSVLVTDINFITRSSFSNGEPIVLIRANISTFPTPVTGTVLYQISAGSNILFGQSETTTFNPGLNADLLALFFQIPIPTGTTFTYSLTATGPGVQPTTNSTPFTITSPDAPPLIFSATSTEKNFTSQSQWMLHTGEGSH